MALTQRGHTMKLFIILLGMIITTPSFAQHLSPTSSKDHNGHPPEHQQLHIEFYSKLTRPGTKMSCCNDKDCRPAQHRLNAGEHEFFVGGKWVRVAKQWIIEDKLTPDGRSHWCGINEGTASTYTYCGIVAPGLF